jgi:hypothetical protein
MPLCDIYYSIERFSEEMNTLLEITLRSRLVEKLCMAMYSCLFEDRADIDGVSEPISCMYV